MALRSQAARHASILGAIDDAVIAIDDDLRISYQTAAADRLFGLRQGEATGRFFADFFPEGLGTIELVKATHELARTTGPFEFRRGADGEVLSLTCACAPICDDVGEDDGIVIVLRDISRETDLLMQLARGERLSALATIAGGIGHEIANPLMVVLAALDRLREEPNDQQALDDAIESTGRISSVVQTMRDFLRGTRESAGSVDVVEVIAQVQRLVRASLPQNVDLVVNASGPLVAHGRGAFTKGLNGIEDEVQEHLAELGPSAASGQQPSTRHVIEIVAAPRDDGDVVVTVRDDGPGMPPDILSRIFEPFFTTRSAGTGTGLGLAIARQITHMFGGDIGVTSVVGAGTTFAVRLQGQHAEASSLSC